jgi:hypothetical protein
VIGANVLQWSNLPQDIETVQECSKHAIRIVIFLLKINSDFILSNFICPFLFYFISQKQR